MEIPSKRSMDIDMHSQDEPEPGIRCQLLDIHKQKNVCSKQGLFIPHIFITYGPRKAVAEVSNHNEPIGRKSGIQLVRKIRKSMDFTFSCFVLN